MRPQMSAKRTQKKPVGRPATGVTKTSPNLTIDKGVTKQARMAACAGGISLSAFVEEAIRSHLASVVAAKMEVTP